MAKHQKVVHMPNGWVVKYGDDQLPRRQAPMVCPSPVVEQVIDPPTLKCENIEGD